MRQAACDVCSCKNPVGGAYEEQTPLSKLWWDKDCFAWGREDDEVLDKC